MTATLRDGTILNIGDEVSTHYHKKCIGLTFVVEAITPYLNCESGTMIVAALKEDRTRKIVGFKKEDFEFPVEGIDANWFKKIK